MSAFVPLVLPLSSAGLAIIGNNVYDGGQNIYKANSLSNSSLIFSSVGSLGIPGNPDDYGSCPAGEHVAVANFDSAFYCSLPDTLHAYGVSPFTWSVLSGPAAISGNGDTVTVTTTGNATVLLSSGSYMYCGSNTDTISITVMPPVSFTANNSPLCSGDTLHLSANTSSLPISYHWNGPAGFTDTVYDIRRANIQLADSGYYHVTETAPGCTATDSTWVSVKPMPSIPVATSNSPLCVGDSLKLTVSNSQLGIGYQWSGPNGFSSSAQNPIRAHVVLADSGKYRVKAILNGCSSGWDTTNVVINAVVVPSANITSLPTVITAGHVDTFTATTNCSGATYQWYKNGTAIPGATGNPYLTLLAAGDHISVKVHCNGCANPDTALSNSLTTVGIPPSPLKGELRVWPNPVQNELVIESVCDLASVSICNVLGQSVYYSILDKSKTIISTKDFAKGVYVVQVVYSDGSKDVVRVVKE